MNGPIAELDRHRRLVETPSGPASIIDTGGDGPVAVFVHGLATSSYLWRRVIAEVRHERRCIALDLPLHGGSPARTGQDVSLRALAAFVADLCDSVAVDRVDLVGNDTGGAVAQIVAACRPDLLRSLTLTNCETHTNLPPRVLLPTFLLARAGLLARLARRNLRDLRQGKRRMYGAGYADLSHLPDQIARAWLEPIVGTPQRAREFQRMVASLRARDLVDIEPALRRLEVPTLVVWGTSDVFFSRRWAVWLQRTIPGAQIVEVPGGRLFFPDERAPELVAAVREHWRMRGDPDARPGS